MSINYSQKPKSLVEVGVSSRALEASRPQTDTLTYEPFFGLDEKAFSLNADQRFIYSSPSYGATRDGLLAGIRRREGLHVLTGEIGTGKTTLCHDVLRDLGRNTFSSMVPDPFASREDLLKMLLIDFGVLSIQELTSGRLRQASRTELGYVLSEFLHSLTPDAFVVVIIDEAQNLTLPLIEETRILSDTFGASGRMQIVFVGQPELHAKLKLPEMRQVDQRVCGYHRLGPMSREAVAGYIQHRLHVAGGRRDRVLFSSDLVNRLHLRSGGVPRLINRVCDRALQLAFEQKAEGVDRVTLEAALSEIGSATLSPTWDAIMADAPAPQHRAEAPLAAAAAAAPAPTAAPAAPDLDTAPSLDESADFQKEVDQWVSKDLGLPARALSPVFAEVTPEQLRAWRRAPRTAPLREVPAPAVASEWPRYESKATTWAKRIAIAGAVLVLATAALVGAMILTSPDDAPAPPALAQSAAETVSALPAPVADAPAEAPVAEAPVSEAPVSAPLNEVPLAQAPIAAAAVSEEYLVAVGLFASRERADQLVDTLTQAGLPALQRPFQLRSREVQQIVLGPFFTRADAVADLRRLQALGGYDDASLIRP